LEIVGFRVEVKERMMEWINATVYYFDKSKFESFDA